MPASFQWDGFQSLQASLNGLTNFDATPLMERWCDIIVEGNRRGVLEGKDGDDNPMPPLKYRGGAGQRTRNRQVPNFGTPVHESTGFGPYAAGFNDNLTTWQYRQLDGPRLAPRRDASRIIKNLHKEIHHDAAAGTWEAVGAWYGVVTPKGKPFLQYHFEGMGHNPRYDLRKVRPRDLQFCLNALRAFMNQLFRNNF